MFFRKYCLYVTLSLYSHSMIYMLIFNFTFMLSNIRKYETDYNNSIVNYSPLQY